MRDKLTGREFAVRARHSVNTGGIWAEQIEALGGGDVQIEAQSSKGVRACQGNALPLALSSVFVIQYIRM